MENKFHQAYFQKESCNAVPVNKGCVPTSALCILQIKNTYNILKICTVTPDLLNIVCFSLRSLDVFISVAEASAERLHGKSHLIRFGSVGEYYGGPYLAISYAIWFETYIYIYGTPFDQRQNIIILCYPKRGSLVTNTYDHQF